MVMEFSRIDHVVMTVHDIEKTCVFYQALGLKVITFKAGRKALKFGNQKINLHQYHDEFNPHALAPTPGSLDICLISKTSIEQVIRHLHTLNIPIEEGPVERTGAQGNITSVYIRDLDQNLIEISNYKK